MSQEPNDKPAREFDALTALKFWTQQAPDNWIQMSESQICVFGARMQFDKETPLYQALKLENEQLEELLKEVLETFNADKQVMYNFARPLTNRIKETINAR